MWPSNLALHTWLALAHTEAPNMKPLLRLPRSTTRIGTTKIEVPASSSGQLRASQFLPYVSNIGQVNFHV